MPRLRRSRRLSYSISINESVVAWVQCADVFGTKLAKPLQSFDVSSAIELCRGFFFESAPPNIESCAIGSILRRIPNDWYNAYGVIKKVAIVYQDVDFGQAGIVYKALGFKPYAKCVRARHFRSSARGSTKGKKKGEKIVWARPLRRVNGMHYKVVMPEPPESMLLPSKD